VSNYYKSDISIDELIALLGDDPDADAILRRLLGNPFQKPPMLSPLKYKKALEKLNYSEPSTGEFRDDYTPLLFDELYKNVPFPRPKGANFSFIDLFAGIGGFRMAMQNLGGECLFCSEWDSQAKKTYEANFGDVPYGDITRIKAKEIPNHDILCAGFPCQAFSIAGKRGGFEDTRGTLFFDVARIIKEKKPKAFFLENVKGLMNHRSGETLKTILNTLRNDLKYYVPEPQVMNAKNFGVPQNRERIFIVGFRLRDHKERHAKKGNGFGYEIIPDTGTANAIVVGGMGRERNLVYDHRLTNFVPVTKIKGEVNREGIRRMTPREWARLQGFPDNFLIPVADASAYKQFGNSVAVPAIQATAQKIVKGAI